MKFKINAWEIGRMMKTILKCTDSRNQAFGNVEISGDGQNLIMRSTNGSVNVEMRTPYMGLEETPYCVDAAMFGRVIGQCKGDVTVDLNERTCVVRGTGTTRIPVVTADIPKADRVKGATIEVSMDDFRRAYDGVAYAVADQDSTRIVLTGILAENDGSTASLVALDGFVLAKEKMRCDGDAFKAVIPGNVMGLAAGGILDGKVKIVIGEGRCQILSDGMVISSGLLNNAFPEYGRIIPETFKTECLVNVEELRGALKAGNVINSRQNLVRIEIGENTLTVRNNGEEADYEAKIACVTQGEPLKIAFNQKYLMNTIAAIDTEEAVLRCNGAVSACVAHGKDRDGVHMVLPVRVM